MEVILVASCFLLACQAFAKLLTFPRPDWVFQKSSSRSAEQLEESFRHRKWPKHREIDLWSGCSIELPPIDSSFKRVQAPLCSSLDAWNYATRKYDRRVGLFLKRVDEALLQFQRDCEEHLAAWGSC